MRYWFLFLGFWTGISAALPPQKLSDTSLYENILQKKVRSENRAYVPQYPLWTDGAHKERWIYLPPGKTIQVDNPNQWVFPVGTKFWKEFSFKVGNKTLRQETRYMEKVLEEEWIFATYLWNPEEKEAYLAPEDGVSHHFEIESGKYHNIPSQTECLRCHRKQGDPVLGFDALQLSNDRDPGALHAETLTSDDVLLKDLIAQNKFNVVPVEFKEGSPRIPASTSIGRSVYGYFHANCASCHNPVGSSLQVRMDVSVNIEAEVESELNAFKALIGKKCLVFQFPGEPSGVRVVKGSPEKSVLFRMLKSTGTERMPNLGTVLHDNLAIEKIREWIKGL